MTMTLEPLSSVVQVLARPALRYGNVHDAEGARDTIARLFAAKDGAAVERVLAWFATAGLRQEWAYFDYYVPRGQLKADPRDVTRARKYAFLMANRAKLGARGLLALDAMRACALAEWSIMAGWLSREKALAAVFPVVSLALGAHASWAEVREQLLLGLEYAEGEIDEELRTLVLALDGPWPRETLSAPASAADVGALRTFALRLTLECPSCGYPVSVPGVVDRAPCRFCGTALSLAPEDWSYFFTEDVTALRDRDTEDYDPLGSDYGVRFFSRRMTYEVPRATCVCGAPLAVSAPGVVRCDCGRAAQVRAADASALAIEPGAKLVVEPLPKSLDPEATFACAACSAEQPLGGDSSRVRTCVACGERTYVDDAAHARSFDPPRRPTVFLVAEA